MICLCETCKLHEKFVLKLSCHRRVNVKFKLSFTIANFTTNAHNPELYLLSPNDNKYNSGLCVFVTKFANLSQPFQETSLIIVYARNNLMEIQV